MTLPSRPCFAVARRLAVVLAVLLSGVASSPTQADLPGDLTGGGSGCGVTMTCTGGGSGSGSGTGGTTLPGGAGGPVACTSNGAGSPCGLSSRPASQNASTTGQNVGAGNPLNVLSGNKYQMEVDLPPLPGVLGLEIVRHYNSQYARPNVPSGNFGRGWKLSYETELYVVKNTVQVVQADGTRIIFNRDARHTSVCATADPSRGKVLVRPTPRGEEFIWAWPDGRRLFFDAHGKLVQIVAPTGEFVSLTRDATGDLLKVTDPQGRSLTLSYGSKAEKATFRGVRFIDSPVGRFAYAYGSVLPDGAEAQAKEAGSVARAVSNLVSVTLPATYAATEKAHPWANRGTTQSAVTRSYHYESAQHPTLLTGISVSGTGSDGVPMQVRVSSWDYDDQARAILSVKGERSSTVAAGAQEAPRPPLQGEGRGGDGVKGVGPETVHLAFPAPGTTVLTNSLGQTTTYRWAQIAGELRLLEAIGPGCASCGPTNVRYAYDAQGRLTVSTQLDGQGKPLTSMRQQRDAAGRVVREERFRFVKGKPVPAGWVRYDYAPMLSAPSGTTQAGTRAGDDTLALPDPKPICIIRPSVVAGKTHEWRFTYNTAGQVRSVTESGFAPALPEAGNGKTGKTGAPTPIERTTAYTYTTVNGRSLLKEIDGPLPNGPKGDPSDSDVTTVTWDGRGDFVASVAAPGNFATTFRRDEAGRVTVRTLDDGARRIETRIAYAGQGSQALTPVRVERTGWSLIDGKPVETGRISLRAGEVQFNALGEPTRQIDAAGRVIQRRFDASGRPASVADGQGYRQLIERDTEGRTMRIGLYRPDSGADPYRATYFWRDESGRPVGQLLPDGRLLSWAHDADGQLTEQIDGDEVRYSFLRTAERTTSARLDQAPDGAVRLSGGRASAAPVLVDDFGQVLRVALPDHGARRAEYDAAGRIVRIVLAEGGRIEFAYDAAGRLTGKRFANREGTTESQTVLRHDGRCLAEVADPAQTSRYTCDALGRHTGESVRLTGLTRTFETVIRFDPASGLVVARTLADGRVLRLPRDTSERGAGVTAMLLQPAWAAAVQDWVAEYVSVGLGETVGRLLPSDTVVRDIAVDPFDGLTGFSAGNGIATRKTFDLAGRLTGLDIDGVERRTYGYAAGPRIRAIETTGPHAASPFKTAFTYSGFGQLVWSDETRPAKVPPVRDALGRVVEHARFRYAYTPQGQLAEVTDKASGNVVARYRYNSAGQRVAKSVFDGEGQERTTFTLWQDGHRVAEIDWKGSITAQTLYLAEGQRATPVAQLDGDRVLAVHADQRGAPVAMTDADQKIVWRANVSPWGTATPANGKSFGPASLNLRLPGQYYDEETGLHDNGFRTYDPATSNYLQPDPLGYPDGPDAYRYAQGDPLNRVDPDGLYAIDVHYYMTYFLALTAGLDDKTAWVVATAAQTIDDVNPYTDALPHLDPWDADSAKARELYHFTQTSTAWAPLNGQTKELLGYATKADNPCLKAQFYGEFLHAYEDTFGHRDRENVPYSTDGHGNDLTSPDKTYNHTALYFFNWDVNEARTLLAEQYVLNQIRKDWNVSANDANGNTITFASLQPFLTEWNAIQNDDEKITRINQELVELGFKPIDDKLYDGGEGLACRLKYFQEAGLIGDNGKATIKGVTDYPDAILNTVTKGATTCKY